MPITVRCENPDCRQACMVPENHVGRLVRCPSCPALIQVPLHPTPAQLGPLTESPVREVSPFRFEPSAEALPTSAESAPPPFSPGTRSSDEASDILLTFFRQCRLGKAQLILLSCAGGCYILMLLGVMFPWQNIRSRIIDQGDYRLGITTFSGVLTLTITLTVLALMALAVLLRNSTLLEIAIWSFTGWAALSTLFRVVDIVTFHGADASVRRSAAFGVYFSLLLSLGALGTSGIVAFRRMARRKNDAPVIPPPPTI